MGRVTEILDSINTNDEEGINNLYTLFHSIRDHEIPIIRFTIYEGSGLIRQRVNNNGELFKNISELSYPPASLTSMGRANLPGNPLFYACSFPKEINDNAPYPRIIALEETSSFMKDKSTSGIERATVSRWDVYEKLELIALPFLGVYNRACPDLLEIKERWQDEISKGTIPGDALELVSFMANEISKEFNDKSQYFKIANFVHYLLRMNAKTKDADGIIYPSVPAQGAGFNVAVKTEVADRKIRFSNASVCYMIKKLDKMTIFTKSDTVIDEYGNMKYVDKVLSPQEASYYNQLGEGLVFVN